MRFTVKDAGGDVNLPDPFLTGAAGLTAAKIDCSAWAASDWVNTEGYLKPGAPGRIVAGLVLPISAASQTADVVCKEATYLGALKADLASALDIDLGFATGGDLNEGLLASIKTSSLSADELAAYPAGGFKLY